MAPPSRKRKVAADSNERGNQELDEDAFIAARLEVRNNASRPEDQQMEDIGRCSSYWGYRSF